jgi:general secretion pathway protein C
MLIYAQNQWVSRGVTFLLGAFAAASVVFWVLKLSAPAGLEPMATAAATVPVVDPAAFVKALGGRLQVVPAGEPVPVAANSRLQLVGVVSTASQRGAALIAVDGKPAKPYVVGATIEGAWVLRSVQARRAVLAEVTAGEPPSASAAEVVLELPVKPQKGV